MRAVFHSELDGLIHALARLSRLTAQMLTNASIALY